MNQQQSQSNIDASCTLRPQKKRKVVSFQTSPPQIKSIPTVTKEEVSVRWHNKQEYDVIKKSVVEILRFMMTQKKDSPEVEYCTRGLELMTPAGSQHTKQIKLRLLAAVWNAQVQQWNVQNQLFDAEAIASACRPETAQCARLARSFGVLDERAAKGDCDPNSMIPVAIPSVMASKQKVVQQPIVGVPRRTSLSATAA
jgi:hypothetical protein